jgi:hypothetical protein
MNAASSTASISIWKERWEWISVNPADLFMCTLSTKDNWQTSRDQKEENNFWKRKVQIIGLVSSSITILPTLTPRRLPTGHPTRPTEYPKISYCHSNFKKKLSECRSRKKNSNKVLIVKIRGPHERLCSIGVPHGKRRHRHLAGQRTCNSFSPFFVRCIFVVLILIAHSLKYLPEIFSYHLSSISKWKKD